MNEPKHCYYCLAPIAVEQYPRRDIDGRMEKPLSCTLPECLALRSWGKKP